MTSDNGDPVKIEELKTIVDFAIEKEKEAAGFYLGLATQAETKALADELRRIAVMEQGHQERLERMDIVLAARSVPRPVLDLHIAEYVVEKKPSPDMSWPDILNVAMHREQARNSSPIRCRNSFSGIWPLRSVSISYSSRQCGTMRCRRETNGWHPAAGRRILLGSSRKGG